MEMNTHSVEITHKNKEVFQTSKITKQEVITYYQSMFSYMEPYIIQRPITMERYPNGVEDKGFYMKDVPDYFPNWIDTVTIENKDETTNEQVEVNKLETLIYIVNQGCITPHTWLSTTDDLTRPNKIIFDLDPSKEDFAQLRKVAMTLYDVLNEENLQSYIMTTGSKGYHVIVPVKSEQSFDERREFAKHIATKVVKAIPKYATVKQRKNKRNNRIFIDVLRNSYGQTSVVPYSLRPLKDAPVATPISWEELKKSPIDPQKYTMKTIKKRLAKIKDPWKNYKTDF